jgi:glycosyltransferase involved in cell wall biosynthesis
VYPPVDVDELHVSTRDDGFLLVAARLLAYRRADLAVAAATAAGRRLIVVGDGPERAALERRAGPSVTFEGHVPRERLIELFETCRAYLVPGEEDFGIAPVEAMAAGKPVIAFGRGGASETVRDGESGILFQEQSVGGLQEALQRLEALAFDGARIRMRSQEFDVPRFRDAFGAVLERFAPTR